MGVNIVFKDGTSRLIHDIQAFLPNLQMETVFDVGANVGQTLNKLVPAYVGARFFAFEPVSSVFEGLQQRYANVANVSVHRVALGPRKYEGRVTTRAATTTNALTVSTREATEAVAVQTGDDFCQNAGLSDISLLKIDTEGFDHEVLRGFAAMLLAGRIDLVQVECSMNPSNRKHVPLETFRNFLEPMGYKLFGLYDQVQEFKRRPVLRRADAVFISERCVEANTLET